MKKFRISSMVSILLLAVVFALSAVARNPSGPGPNITSITLNGTDVVVKVSAPAGIRKLTLEGRSRLEGSAWAPKALKRFDSLTTEAQEITFTLARSENLEVLRVRADATEALPAAFFKGTNQFAGPQGVSGAPTTNFEGAPNADAGMGAGGPTEARAVVESDIWKITGDTLYFFNNLRGLQVINVANPAAPAIKGTFAIPASGEQMYVLPSGHAVLLARNWCSYSETTPSQVVIVDGSGVTPTLAAQVAIQGWILESRMVGNALYVVSQTYRQIPYEQGGFTWEAATQLTSIDLTNPTTPITRGSQAIAPYSNTIYANDRYLLCATWNYQRNGADVQIVDISSPNGEFSVLSKIRVAGAVADKFKFNIDGDTLTVISHVWNDTVRWVTTLENFSLANPREPVRVGSLRLAEGEQLHATRFDGKRAYIVTFFRIDPLWIIDLTDPAHPTIAGELHVPGWSTYLHPLGDRVLALGIDDTNSWRVALSLFDVSNPAAPTLLSKVALGQNSSWSEANYDEKALTVLPNSGLVLVPWSGYTQNGQSSHVQLIDLAQNTLTARGQISDHLYPRRATLHRDHLVSISGRELITYEAANRDQPILKSRLDLAWPVNKVLLAGDYLIELETASSYGWYHSAPTRAIIRVASANAPETIISSVTLTNPLPIVGSELRDNKLYIAQARSSYYFPWFIVHADGTQQAPEPDPASLSLSIWDVSQLPTLTKLSETTTVISENFGGGSLTAIWPKPNLLVWSGGGQSWGWGWGWDWIGMPIAVASDTAMGVGADIAIGPWWGGGGNSGRFTAFDVADSANPAFKSHIDLTTNGVWNVSKPIVVEGLVYLSHQKNETIEIDPPTPTEPADATNPDAPKPDGTSSGSGSSDPGWGGNRSVIFVTRYYLDVVDYTDAVNPVIRKPVNIPGSLQGVTHQGGVLYTVGAHFNAQGNSDGTEWLDASAYDGVSAFLIDSLSFTNWPHTVVLNGPDIFIGRPTSLERWRLADEGMLTKLSSTDTKEPVNNLRFFGDLAALTTNAKIQLYNATDRASLKLIGESPMSCNGGDLENADGALNRGLWLPANDYGIQKISLTPPAE